ncbi:MAG: hypothetical protein WAR57_00230 [Candidatus Phosphoribacter sp.]
MNEHVPLGELVEITRGTTYKSALLDQPGPVLLGLASIARNGGFRGDSLRTYGGESPPKLLVQPGCLYGSLKDVTQSGDLLGSVARLPLQSPPGRLTQDTVRLDVVSDRVDADYLYLALLGPRYRAYCRAHATGTTNLGLPRDDFLAYPVWLPDVPEQRRIAAVLGALDGLLETNTANAQRVRELVLAAYQAETTGGDITRFGEVAHLVREQVGVGDLESGVAYLGLEHFAEDNGGIVGVGDAGDVGSAKTAFVRGDVLYGKLRPYFRKVDRVGFDGVCSTELWVMRPCEGWGAATLWAITMDPAFTDFAMAGNTGTRMPRANWHHVASMEVSAPPEGRRAQLESQLNELWAAMVALRDEIEDLTRARDALLPLLMAGTVRVSKDFAIE